ncbi:MAG: hypothetical protein LC659_09675 [Myxococcales bacterium]|nr:hypothetical protein [Myxococcales bacterium]
MACAAKVKMWKLSALTAGVMLLVLTFLVGRASAVPEPNMEAALGHLEQAKAALDKAEHNKGGLRLKALDHVNQAIAATREAIAVGNK